MGVEGCARCLKYLLFVFNLFFFAIGVIVLSLGAWLYVEFNSFLDDLAGVEYLNGPILLIAVGTIIAMIAFLGCCGACMENKIMLYIFGSLMFVTFVLELVAGILAYVNDYDDELRQTLIDTLPDYGKKDAIRKGWDTVQKNLDCCGVDNYTDWFTYGGSNFNKTDGIRVPSSCCKLSPCPSSSVTLSKGIASITLSAGSNIDKEIYTRGCYEEIKSKFEGNTIAVAAVGITFAVVQVLGVIFAFAVACKIDGSQGVV